MARSQPLTIGRRAVSHAIYVVPGCTVLIATSLLLLGRARSGPAARIHGGPPGPDAVAAWRITAVDRSVGVELPLRHARLLLQVHRDQQPIGLEGTTDEEGAWEARIPLGSSQGNARVDVLLSGQPPRLLCTGQIPLGVPAWQASQHAHTLPVPGQASGELALSVSPMRGVFSAPYPDMVSVQVRLREGSDPVSGATVSIEGQGIAWDGPPSAVTDPQGRARLRIRPLQHEVRAELRASSAGRSGTWSGLLPVVPGALWIDPRGAAEGRIRVSSPVAHHFAYVTTIGRSSRLHAARVPLTPDDSGAFGEATIPRPPPDSWLLVSPDPPGRETQALGWPVVADDASEPRSSLVMRTPLLLDGMPMAQRELKRQSLRTRVRALAVLGLGALLEAALIWLRVQKLQDEVDAALRSLPDEAPELAPVLSGGRGFWLRLLVACVFVALGFFAVALITWLGTL